MKRIIIFRKLFRIFSLSLTSILVWSHVSIAKPNNFSNRVNIVRKELKEKINKREVIDIPNDDTAFGEIERQWGNWGNWGNWNNWNNWDNWAKWSKWDNWVNWGNQWGNIG
ncbi:hypothetical protein ACE38W_17650 [Chitinophaga sp. Hz27]|uniref:hypothetical protein n=1 Tax=Chitinophaga sp. Hz27 TaxID=3347169 RepID=UPI0035E0EE82